jgi:long-chain acyl-CoA synthetase
MSIISILRNSAHLFANKTALIDAEKNYTISYIELYQSVIFYAQFLKEQGLQTTQKAAIFMPNSCEYIIALFALLYLGVIPVLIDHRFCEREITQCLHLVKVEALVISPQHADQSIGLALVKQKVIEKVFTLSPEPLSLPFIHYSLDLSGRSVKTDRKKAETELNNGEPLMPAGDRKLIFFTYRGLGYPLPVLLNERAVYANVLNNNVLTRITEQTVISLILPLSHIFALCCNFLSPLSVGATIVIINSLAPAETLNYFENYKLNFIAAVPSQIYMLLHSLRKKQYNLTALKQGVIGGDAFGQDLHHSWKELTKGGILVQGYGLTEACAVICNGWQDYKPESMGKVMQGVEGVIRDEKGNYCTPNQPGILWLKATSLMEGYVNQPVLNKQLLQQGWFDTGDLVYQDTSGYFYFVKRLKQIAKIGATTVDIREVTQVITQMPGIKEVSIEITSDKLWQEKLICSVKIAKPLTITDIKEFCKSSLALYKIPKDVIIINKNDFLTA